MLILHDLYKRRSTLGYIRIQEGRPILGCYNQLLFCYWDEIHGCYVGVWVWVIFFFFGLWGWLGDKKMWSQCHFLL